MHVKLSEYTVPPGIKVPNLMPYQLFPWNGDGYLAAEVLRLKEAHGLNKAIETGTCLGSTTLWLRENFRHTWSIEIHRPYFDIAVQRMIAIVGRHIKEDVGTSNVWIGGHNAPGDPNSAMLIHGDSAKSIYRRKDALKHNEEKGGIFWFADAHWNEHCPLLEELDSIAKSGIHPCILIHDFQVPGTDFGFDKMPDGRPFDMQLICNHLNDIYGQDKWTYNYPTNVEGARRGWISIEPVQP